MEIAIQLPDDFAVRLQAQWGDLSQRTLEAIAVEAYREEMLTAAEVRKLLGHTSRWQTEQFLYDKQAYLHYDEDDLAHDLAIIRAVDQSMMVVSNTSPLIYLSYRRQI